MTIGWNEYHRPRYHFLPPRNWMNDPNGLIHFRGHYHLFYQHNPNAPIWQRGHLAWGHAVSTDLVHWKHLPLALVPDQPYDAQGVFSGCAVDDNGTPTILYTGVEPQTQCLATSQDMNHWEKYAGNPVLVAPPDGFKTPDFRDPYVWRDGDRWFMVVGSALPGVGGAALLYQSSDLRRWDFLHPLLVGDKAATGEVWECPNFFPLGNKWVLVIAPIPLGRAIYLVGDFRDLQFHPQSQGEIDVGGCLYAPQIFRDATGRTILFGWLWEEYKDAQEFGWQGVQTLPCQLGIGQTDQVIFAPVREVQSLHREIQTWECFTLTPDGPNVVAGVKGNELEIEMHIEPRSAPSLTFSFYRSPDGQEETLAVLDFQTRTFRVDRTRSSQDERAKRDVRSVPLPGPSDKPLVFRVFLDHSVVEFFLNDQLRFTSRVYPTRRDSHEMSLSVDRGSCTIASLKLWNMERLWIPEPSQVGKSTSD